jgi:hypothetical protein
MLPHAPQFFTMPETEDRDTDERVQATAAEIGARREGPGARSLDHLFERETLPIRLPDEFETDLAWTLSADRNFRWKACLGRVPDMDRERRRRLMERLLGMIVERQRKS